MTINKKTIVIDNINGVHYLNQLYPEIYDTNGNRYSKLPKQILKDSLDKLDHFHER